MAEGWLDAVQLADAAAPGGERRLGARLGVPADAPLLQGHFPGAPLVPGVVLLGAVRDAAAAALQRPLRLAALAEARFLQPVAPGEVVELRGWLAVAGDAVRVHGEFVGAAGRKAAFDLALAPDGA